MEYGKLLKEELDKKGYRYKHVAKETYLPYNSLIGYLNGHKPMPASKVQLVCLTFGIDPKIFGLGDNISNHKEAS